MSRFGWYRDFQKPVSMDDIPAKVKKLEIQYWLWQVVCIAIAAYGVHTFMTVQGGNLTQAAYGLFIAVCGVVALGVIKVWGIVRHSMYWAIHASQSRT